jgi:superfamily II DNA or RNA helicase
METIKIALRNHSYLMVSADRDIQYELKDYFTFDIPGAKYTPKFKAGIWDGTISLYNTSKSQLYAGVLSELEKFCEDRDYKLEFVDSEEYGSPKQVHDLTDTELSDFIKTLELPFEVRDYQFNAVHTAIQNKRNVILSSTGSGKSLIIYIMTRYLVDELDNNVLIVVPTTTLVHQMTGDFESYGYDVSLVHKIMSGAEKNTEKKVVISTWQSLMRLPPEWFSRFKVAIIDECHGCQSTELTKLLEKCTNAEFRYGLTGSLDNSKTHQMSIKGNLGPIFRVTETHKLISQGHLSEIKIKALVLDYSRETKKLMAKQNYPDEIDFIVRHEKRNRFICNLARSLKGNTLILYNFIEKHGDVLDVMLREKISEGQYFYIHGGVDGEDRNQIRGIVEESENAVILASMGTFSVGVNLKRLHNLILASPTKSVIRVLQSIGRGLRKGEGKDKLTVFDIADDLSNSKTAKNFAYKHFVERLKIYTNESFPYTITTVPIE